MSYSSCTQFGIAQMIRRQLGLFSSQVDSGGMNFLMGCSHSDKTLRNSSVKEIILQTHSHISSIVTYNLDTDYNQTVSTSSGVQRILRTSQSVELAVLRSRSSTELYLVLAISHAYAAVHKNPTNSSSSCILHNYSCVSPLRALNCTYYDRYALAETSLLRRSNGSSGM